MLATRENLAVIRGQFTDAARVAEQAAGLARAGGDRADASIEFSSPRCVTCSPVTRPRRRWPVMD